MYNSHTKIEMCGVIYGWRNVLFCILFQSKRSSNFSLFSSKYRNYTHTVVTYRLVIYLYGLLLLIEWKIILFNVIIDYSSSYTWVVLRKTVKPESRYNWRYTVVCEGFVFWIRYKKYYAKIFELMIKQLIYLTNLVQTYWNPMENFSIIWCVYNIWLSFNVQLERTKLSVPFHRLIP